MDLEEGGDSTATVENETQATETQVNDAPQQSAEPERITTTVTRERDPATGKFVRRVETTDAANRESAAESKPSVDDSVFDRAEKAGLTRYEASQLGDGLLAELERIESEASRYVEEPRRQEARETKQEPPPAPAAAATVDSPLAKLPDLDPAIYGEDVAERDKLLRQELQRLAGMTPELQSLKAELDQYRRQREEEADRQHRELVFDRATKLEGVIAKLGDDFADALGKGGFRELQASKNGAGYIKARDEVFKLAWQIQEGRPKLSWEQACSQATTALYPDKSRKAIERDIIQKARDAAKKHQSYSGGARTDATQAESSTGRLRDDPGIRAKLREIERRKAGLE